MANGYGGSGGSGGSGSSGGSGGYVGLTEEDYTGSFVKIKDGVRAPDGFHYMPNGKLMNDAHHIAENGYIEKTITNVEVDYADIAPGGGDKNIIISGSEGAVFSIEIYGLALFTSKTKYKRCLIKILFP